MAEESAVRYGVIGCVKKAKKVLRAISLAPNAVLHAVADTSLETANQFALSNGLPESVKIYGSYDQLLDDASVDAVYLPLPRDHLVVDALRKKKHVLMGKPTTLGTAGMQRVAEESGSNGVQLMDETAWLHHRRTSRIKEMVSGSGLLGDVHSIYSTMTALAPPEALEKLTEEALGSLGAIGELGWYPVGATLWAKGYQLPTSVTAVPNTATTNSAGVVLSCTAFIHYNLRPPATATIHCSFHSHLSMDLAITGSRGTIHVKDFGIPFQEEHADFEFTSGAKFVDMHVGWNVKPEKVTVPCEERLPQEGVMIRELSRLICEIQRGEREPDRKWIDITTKTMMVLEAVKKSIDLGFRTVYLT